MTPGERILMRRHALGLSQRDIVEGTDYSPAYISRIEGGYRNPSTQVLVALAKPLQTSALWLQTGSESVQCAVCGRSD